MITDGEPTEGTDVDDNGKLEIADFSFSPEPKTFTINGDVFKCTPELPLGLMAKAATIKFDAKTLREDPEHALDPLVDFFASVMFEDSFKIFQERLTDKERPIGLRHIMKILPWLLEVYGLTPTMPPSDSSGSSVSDGETSTAGASSAESNPSSSQPTADSISSITTPALSSNVS